MILKKNLLNYMTKDFNTNNSLEIENKSNSKSDSYFDEMYFDNKEQICEVKLNLYYILSLSFFSKEIAVPNIMFLIGNNLVKDRRLIIQSFSMNNKNIL